RPHPRAGELHGRVVRPAHEQAAGAADLGLVAVGPDRLGERPERRADELAAVAAGVDPDLGPEVDVLVVPALAVQVADGRPAADEDAVLDGPVARLARVRLPAGQ